MHQRVLPSASSNKEMRKAFSSPLQLEHHYGRQSEARVSLPFHISASHHRQWHQITNHEVLCDFTNKTLEGQLVSQPLDQLLITTDSTKNQHSRMEQVRLLHMISCKPHAFFIWLGLQFQWAVVDTNPTGSRAWTPRPTSWMRQSSAVWQTSHFAMNWVWSVLVDGYCYTKGTCWPEQPYMNFQERCSWRDTMSLEVKANMEARELRGFTRKDLDATRFLVLCRISIRYKYSSGAV